MDEEDLKPRAGAHLAAIAAEDLGPLSVADLEARIATLKSEIDRCEGAIKDRKSTQNEAEKFFNL